MTRNKENNKDESHRKVLNTSIWTLLQIIFLQAGALLTTMCITRLLPTSEYGLLPLINSLVLFSIILLGLGLPGSLGRYLASQDSVTDKKVLLERTLVSMVPWFFIAIVSLIVIFPLLVDFLGKPQLLELKWFYIAILSFELFRVFIEKICHGTQYMHISASFSGWSMLSVFIVTVPFAWISPTAVTVLSAKIVALVIPMIRVFLSVRKIFDENGVVGSSGKIPQVKEVIRYGIPLAAILIADFGFIQADILFLGYFSDISTVSLYAVGVFLLVKLTALSRAIGFGLAPIYANKDKADLGETNYFLYGLKYALMVALPLAIFLGVNGDSVMVLVFGAQYEGAGETVVILSIYFIMASTLAVINPILDFSGKARARAYASLIGAAINVILNFLLIPRYGAIGAAIATICGYAVLFSITAIIASKLGTTNIWKNYAIMRLVFFIGPLLFISMSLVKYVFRDTTMWLNLALLLTLYPVALHFLSVVRKSEYIAFKRVIFGN